MWACAGYQERFQYITVLSIIYTFPRCPLVSIRRAGRACASPHLLIFSCETPVSYSYAFGALHKLACALGDLLLPLTAHCNVTLIFVRSFLCPLCLLLFFFSTFSHPSFYNSDVSPLTGKLTAATVLFLFISYKIHRFILAGTHKKSKMLPLPLSPPSDTPLEDELYLCGETAVTTVTISMRKPANSLLEPPFSCNRITRYRHNWILSPGWSPC